MVCLAIVNDRRYKVYFLYSFDTNSFSYSLQMIGTTAGTMTGVSCTLFAYDNKYPQCYFFAVLHLL